MTDHRVKIYMTPIVYKGRELMGYVATCSCSWRGTYASREARVLGIERHKGE